MTDEITRLVELEECFSLLHLGPVLGGGGAQKD